MGTRFTFVVPGIDAAEGQSLAHFVEEAELMREFGIDLHIRLVAAGRHVEIMQRQRIA